MIISSKKRLKKYLGWWVKKTRQSSRWFNSLVVVGLCVGLFWIASLYEAPKSRYDQTPFDSYPIELKCKMVRVVDGDTVIVKCPKSSGNSEETIRSIRVWGIDAPETKQKYWGKFAAQTLKRLLQKNTTVRVHVVEQDRYQRMLGKIYIGDIDLGLEMVKQGAAVVYHRYNKDQDYIKAEKEAKIMRLGIWQVLGAQHNPEHWRRFNP